MSRRRASARLLPGAPAAATCEARGRATADVGRPGVVPASVVDAARRAFACRLADTDVAENVEDLQAGGRRQPRRLQFRTDRLRLHVEVRQLSEGLLLRLRVSPPSVMLVQVRHRGPPVLSSSDSHGECVLAPVQRGPVSLVLTGREGRTATSWLPL